MKLNLVTLAVAIVGLVFLGMYAAKLPWTAWRIVGMALAAPAFLLFSAARIELGRAFSVRAKATTLVTTGIYSRIRNPIYFFGALMILGIIIWTGRLWLLLILAVLIPLQVARSRKEERVHNVGHTATVFHPGGGEFANVASNWLKWILKGDKEAAAMFIGKNCRLCTNPNWDVRSKGFTE